MARRGAFFMESPNQLSLEGLEVTVTETPDTVTYTFTPREHWRPNFPVASSILFVGLPLTLLGFISYAHDATRGTRPEWELLLTGLFAVQLGIWGAVGMGFVWRAFTSWWMYRRGTSIVFRGTQLRHAGDIVCELADVRGLRMFVYPSDETVAAIRAEDSASAAPVAKSLATLSFIIGSEGYTHGLLASFDPVALRRLADDIHRRLAAFRTNQGVMEVLAPIDVVQTTEKDAASEQHTRPPTNRTRLTIALLNFGMLAFTNPVVSTLWCVPMFAGLYASGRLILASGIHWMYLAGHVVLGILHAIFLAGAWGYFGPLGAAAEDEKK